jgi:ribonuclease R
MTTKRFKSDPHASREATRYERPIPSREFILDHLSHRKEPASYLELVEELGLKGEEEQQEALHRRIKAMLREGQIERLRGGFFGVAQERLLVEGTVLLEKGKQRKIWVLPKEGGARILLTTDNAPPVYTGNQVIVAAVESAGSELRVGRLVEIISQKATLITGRFIQEMGFCHVIPHSKELTGDILIPQGKEGAAVDGQMVVVELLKGQSRWSEPLGQVVEILGDERKPGIEV